jgi:hypothetical protein
MTMYEKRKSRKSSLHPVTVLCLTTLLGCIAGGASYFLPPYLPSGTWEMVIIPPAKAVRLLAYRSPQIFIKTNDNKIYACEPLTQRQSVDPSPDRRRNTCILASEPQDTPN